MKGMSMVPRGFGALQNWGHRSLAVMRSPQWLRAQGSGAPTLRRAVRTGVVVPAVVALAMGCADSADFVLFAAFGSLAGLLFVDFRGPVPVRLLAQTGLVSVGTVLVCLGTLASRTIWTAAAATLVVAFSLLFVGVVSSVLAGATTALLVSFILPVMSPGSVGSIPDRLGGWILGGTAALIGSIVLWPAPVRDPLHQLAAHACASLARQLRAEVEWVHGDFEPQGGQALEALAAEAAAVVTDLRTSFFTTSYRPTGLSTASHALIRLIDQVVWLKMILERVPLRSCPKSATTEVCSVESASATLLERGATLLKEGGGDPSESDADLRRLEQAWEAMERTVTSLPPSQRAETENSSWEASNEAAGEFIRSLQPSFRAQQTACAVSVISSNIDVVVAAHQRSPLRHILGCRAPEGLGSPLSSARERVRAQAERHSVWLRNSVRGAVALCLAVLAADLSSVQHGFWVVFGALTVLCSNALNTGRNSLGVLMGNVVGLLISGGLIFAVGTTGTVFLLLLPPTVALAALAPEVVPVTLGQAGFATALLILYDLVDPGGWEVGLVRLENVAIGCGVSLVVGALFWPHGAGSVLGRALGECLSDSAHYLHSAIERGLTGSDEQEESSMLAGDRRRALLAARRLDEAFRGFLAERGTKHVPQADVTTLINGGVVLRVTADAVLRLWSGETPSAPGDRTAGGAEILREIASVVDWYEKTAQALAGTGTVPGRLGGQRHTCSLVEAVHRDLSVANGPGTATVVRMIWTAEHIGAVRRLQKEIREPAEAASQRRSPLSWFSGRRSSSTRA
jgi:Fusaric acid resistance protein-like